MQSSVCYISVGELPFEVSANFMSFPRVCRLYNIHMFLIRLSLGYPRVYAGWAVLLVFIGESIVHGSKEVSLAAIASLNPLLIAQAAKVILFPRAETSVLHFVSAFTALIPVFNRGFM